MNERCHDSTDMLEAVTHGSRLFHWFYICIIVEQLYAMNSRELCHHFSPSPLVPISLSRSLPHFLFFSSLISLISTTAYAKAPHESLPGKTEMLRTHAISLAMKLAYIKTTRPSNSLLTTLCNIY